MKKVLRLLIVVTVFSTLLVGCSKNEREQLINEGIAAYAIGDNEKAFNSLKSAKMLKDFKEDETQASNAYADSGNTLWTQYKDAGAAKEASLDFEGALEEYMKAQSISSMKELTLSINNMNVKIKQQSEFNEYVSFYNEIISESNTLLRTYSTLTDNFALDNEANKFNTEIKVIIPKSNEIVAKIDDAISSVGENLTPIHQEVISLVNFQHNTFLGSLSLPDNSTIPNLKSQYLTIKKTQTEITQKLKNYASTEGVLFLSNINKQEK